MVNAIMREPRPTLRNVEDMRAGFVSGQARDSSPTRYSRRSQGSVAEPSRLSLNEQWCPGTVPYFHGGACTLGAPETSPPHTANLVIRPGMQAFSLDYRPAPENAFPFQAFAGVLDETDQALERAACFLQQHIVGRFS